MKTCTRAIAVTAMLFCFGCAKENIMETRARLHAPTKKADVGVILQDAKVEEVTSLLTKNPNAKVRVLNKEHGMYEVFGVTKEVAQAATQGRASDNEYFDLKSDDTLDPLSALEADGTSDGDLAPCAKSIIGGPQALLEVSPANLADSIVELGLTVKVSGVHSTAANGPLPKPSGGTMAPPGLLARMTASLPLKGAILVVGPGASARHKFLVKGLEAEFKPDALGLYKVILMVQDGKNRCSASALQFIVTVNRPYNGPNAVRMNLDLDKFTHLKAVSAQEGWQLSQGEGITIAIIDSGVNYNHPTLAPNIKLNENEIPENHIDDDKNGYVDDVLGYDFVSSDPYPYDDVSHGTHVAGLAAAREFGLAPKAKILAVKAVSAAGGDIGSISAAIIYSVDRGARIINLSLGTVAPKPEQALVDAMAYAEKKGVIVVAAVGNGDPETGLGFDIDSTPEFPASLPNDNLITVASFNSNNVLASYSNFGKVAVDVVAPGGGDGELVFSAAYENPINAAFIGLTGTSMACPIVAGMAADILALNPQLTPVQVRAILVSAGNPVPDLAPVTVSGRHVDLLSALNFTLNLKSNLAAQN